MADTGSDPLALWRTMVGEMEKGVNSFANQAMGSPEFSRVVNQVGGISAGAQKQLGDLVERYLVAMNLPSHAQVVALGERLQAIEAQLGEIRSLLQDVGASRDESPASAALRPPRTRRPDSGGASS